MYYVRHVTKVMILFVLGSIFDIQPTCKNTYGYALLIINTRLHGVFPFLWSIREMCCIISMLGRDAHMNIYLTHIIVLHPHISLMNYYLSSTTLKRE